MRSFHIFLKLNLQNNRAGSLKLVVSVFYYVCACFACMYVCAPHACLAPVSCICTQGARSDECRHFVLLLWSSLISAHEVGGTFKSSLPLVFWKHTHRHTQNCVSMVILNLITLAIKIDHKNTVYIKLQVKSFPRSIKFKRSIWERGMKNHI